jgi:hypothetical protein
MLEAEKSQPDNEKYGAHITHWSGKASPINIDAGAIQALIDYYTGKNNEHPVHGYIRQPNGRYHSDSEP